MLKLARTVVVVLWTEEGEVEPRAMVDRSTHIYSDHFQQHLPGDLELYEPLLGHTVQAGGLVNLTPALFRA